MPRYELHTDDIKVPQKHDVSADPARRESDVIIPADKLPNQDYLDELAFNEEPMIIRIEPGNDRNAALRHPIWVDGIGAEVLLEKRWRQVTWLPVGVAVITKRKYVAVLADSKQDTVQTVVQELQGEDPTNKIRRVTSRAVSFSVIEDKNPKGAAWLTDLLNRA